MTGFRLPKPDPKQKKRLTFFLDAGTKKQVEYEARQLHVSRQQIMESAVKARYSPEAQEEREAQIISRLNRIDTRMRVLEHDLMVIAEIQNIFMRMWLTANIEVSESQRVTLQAEGQKRYERFMTSLSKRIGSGQSILAELPREVALSDDSFHSK